MTTEPPVIETRAARAGTLTDLDALGVRWTPLVARDGSTVAALVDDGDREGLCDLLLGSFAERGLWPLWYQSALTEDVLAGAAEVTTDAETVLRARGWGSSPWARTARLADPAVEGTCHDYDVLPIPFEDTALVVVPVARPADVPAALGWEGPANHDLAGHELSAVLRSWEDRFGAIPVAIGFDTIALIAAETPDDDAQLDLLAREIYTVCPDNIDQGYDGDLAAYLPEVADGTWAFWWD